MKAILTVAAKFEMEIDDKYQSMVNEFNPLLADELIDHINKKVKGQSIDFTEACLMGVLDENGNPLCEWAENNDTELKVE